MAFNYDVYNTVYKDPIKTEYKVTETDMSDNKDTDKKEEDTSIDISGIAKMFSNNE